MKSLILSITAIGSSLCLLAQPGDGEIRQRAMNAGASETRFTSDKGTVHTTLTEKWYIRTMESKWNTDYPEIKRWERTEYRYDYSGGSWVFNRSYHNSSWYDGIPNPSEAEIIDILERSKVGYQGAVIEKPIFKIAEDPKWNWHTYNRVEVMVEAILFEKINHTEVAKKKITFPVNLYRDTGNGQHDPNTKIYHKNAPWLTIYQPVISSTYGKQEVLETKTYSSEQADLILTVLEIEEEKESEQRLQALGNLEIPKFQSDKEAIVWIHQLLREGNEDKIELMLRKMLTPYYFRNGSAVTLIEPGQNLVANLRKVASHYSTLYCEHPTIKHEQENMIQFYDRENQSHARIALEIIDGVYRINDIDCWFDATQSKLNACSAAGESNCGEPIDTSPAKILERFEIGDAVTVNWNGQNTAFYNGKVVKTDSFDANRYFIEFEEIQSAWIHAEYISKRNSPSLTNPEKSEGNESKPDVRNALKKIKIN